MDNEEIKGAISGADAAVRAVGSVASAVPGSSARNVSTATGWIDAVLYAILAGWDDLTAIERIVVETVSSRRSGGNQSVSAGELNTLHGIGVRAGVIRAR